MSNSVVRQVCSDFLNCCICLDVFKVPKTLECGHTFCERCISDHIQSRSTSRALKGFECPACREFISAKRADLDISLWAEQMTTNFALQSIVESIDQDTNQASDDMCPQHGKPLEAVCMNCDTPSLCYTCIMYYHRQCSQVHTVHGAAQERKSNLNYLLGGIDERLSKADLREKELQKESQQLNTQRDQVRVELDAMFAAAKKRTHDEFERVSASLEKCYAKCDEQFQTEIQKVNDYRDILERYQAMTKNVLDGGDMSVVDRYNEVKVKLEQTLRASQDAIVSCTPGYTLSLAGHEGNEKKMSEVNFGDITVTKHSRELRFLMSSPERQSSRSSLFRDSMVQGTPEAITPTLTRDTTKFRLVRKIPASTKHDRTSCCLLDVTIVNGNVVVAIDGDNRAVKSFTVEGLQVETSQYSVNKILCGITSLGDSTVVVLAPKFKEMLLLLVSPSISLKKIVRTQQSYYAVCTLSLDTLAVCTSPSSGSPRVDVIDMRGQLLHTMTTGNNLLANPMHMSRTSYGGVIITDSTVARIVCLRQNGNLVFRYNPEDYLCNIEIKKPAGVSVATEGTVLVADKESNSVHALSHAGVFLKTLLTQSDTGEAKLTAVAVGHRGLIVTMHERVICIFQINSLNPVEELFQNGIG